MDDNSGNRGNPDLSAVTRIVDETSGNEHGERKSDEFLQLAETSELAKHNLAEYHFAQRRADGGIKRMKQDA
ncbi:hypothetical protein D3C76_1765840 [compost metagenome]